MEDKKVCKKLIKRAKKHPEWYTPEEVLYAKLMRKEMKCGAPPLCWIGIPLPLFQ